MELIIDYKVRNRSLKMSDYYSLLSLCYRNRLTFTSI